MSAVVSNDDESVAKDEACYEDDPHRLGALVALHRRSLTVAEAPATGPPNFRRRR
jgi:hypothetical protein